MRNLKIDFFGNRKIYFTVSLGLIALMLLGSLVFGVQLDIQFKGGALITYSYEGELDKDAFKAEVETTVGQSVTVQESTDVATGKKNLVLSMSTSEGLDADRQLALSEAVTEKFAQNNLNTEAISVVNPTIGMEFLQKSLVAVAFAALLMVIYIGLRFKKISGWSAGITAVIALIHDLLMVLTAFVLMRFSLNANFIAVCLTILGYSLNDTIVIYDRVRENRRIYGAGMPVEELVNLSLNQSMIRSLMTTITTVSAMAVVSLVAYFYNVTSILSFSVPMIAGMLSGVYSSLCIAPVLWVIWQKKKAAQ